MASGVAATTAVSFAWLSRQPARAKSGPLDIIIGRKSASERKDKDEGGGKKGNVDCIEMEEGMRERMRRDNACMYMCVCVAVRFPRP